MRSVPELRLALITLAVLCIAHQPVAAQSAADVGTQVTIELINGDVLSGRLLEATENLLVIQHEILGRIEIERTNVRPALEPEEDEPGEPVWTGSFDIALTGSGGNTDTQTFRVGVDARKETDVAVDTVNFFYRRLETDGDSTEAKGFLLGRHEWKEEGSRWRPFVQGTLERDQFTDYGERVAINGGAGYLCLEGPDHTLTGRAGLGAAKELDGVDRSWTPEGLLGFDYLWAISEETNFRVRTDIYPNLEDTGEYRSISGIAWESKVDPDSAWLMKIGMDHFYDSVPGPMTDKGDYNYYIGIGRGF